MRVKHREVARLAADIRGFAAWLVDHAEEVAHRANSDSDEHVNGVCYDRQRSAPGHSDPAALRAMRWDPAKYAQDRWLSGLRTVAIECRDLWRQADGFLPLSPEQAHQLATKEDVEHDSFLGHCVNCGSTVAGTANDRLRSGRCPACFEYRRRTSIERPRALWDGHTDTGDAATAVTG